MKTEYLLPEQIEKRSFEIIESELDGCIIPEEVRPIVMRVIHTTADLEYSSTMVFSPNAPEDFYAALEKGSVIVTDTNMAKAGINKNALKKYGTDVFCFMSDEDVAKRAKEEGRTRAAVSADKAAELGRPVIYVCGNAPTALIRICENIKSGRFIPEFVIGVPVGFVNVVYSKQLLMSSGVPHISNKSRKGGSNVAAAICNALLYMKK